MKEDVDINQSRMANDARAPADRALLDGDVLREVIRGELRSDATTAVLAIE